MAILDYTTYDDIRAALGVSTDELEDATLALSLYEFGFSADLRSVSLGIDADYATVLAIEESSWTSDQRVFVECATLFATYSVAQQCLASLPLFSPKEITDGKASVTRYAQNPYKDTMQRVEAWYNRYRDALITAYAAFKATSRTERTTLVFMASAALSTDPVTGE